MHGSMNGGRLAVAAAGVITCVLMGGARAGETEVRVEVEAIVPPLQRLAVDPLVLATPEIQAEDLAAGFVWLPEPVVLSVSSNVPWEVSIRLAGHDKAGDGGAGRDASILDWSARNAQFRPVTGEWATVAASRGPAASERVELHLRVPLRPGETTPGVYHLQLDYRLVPADE